MKFKEIAVPKPSAGTGGFGAKLVVPDQSLSLKEILARFVRKEVLPVAHTAHYGSEGSIDPESDHEFNIDLEKAKHWDLTEKAEFIGRVRDVHEAHSAAVRKKDNADKAAAKEKADAEYEQKVREKIAREEASKKPSI